MSEIDKEIENKEKELRDLQNRKRDELIKSYIKPLNDITDEEKIEWFNRTWKSAYKDIIFKISEGEDYCDDNDDAHYAWEDYIKILSPEIFKLYNCTDLGE